MRALVWRGDHDIRLEDADEPKPRPDEMLLRVLAAGICGSDLGRYAGLGSGQPPPLILGHEFAGEVVVAARSGGAAKGDRVAVYPFVPDGTCAFCLRGQENLCPSRALIGVQRPGAFADLVAVPAAGCYALPRGTPAEVGALVEPFACALHAAAQGAIRSDDRLLVLGAGGIGTLTIVAAVNIGLRSVTVSDRSARRRETALAAGADEAIDPTSVSARPRFDLVIDTVGTADTRKQALDVVATGGRVVLVGIHDTVLDIPARRVIRDEVTVVGSFAYTRRSFADAVALAGKGLLESVAAICTIRALSDGPRTFEELTSRALIAPRAILGPS